MSNIVINPKTNTKIINKSKFIAFVYRVQNLGDIQHHLNLIKDQYRDASHIVYAYRINDQIIKCDEDKEPTNTSGKPILAVLVQKDIVQVLVIVVRYFGGVLLGVGNLKRAYLQTFLDCLDQNLVLYQKTYQYQINANYSDLSFLNNYFHQTNMKVLETIYQEDYVIFKIQTTFELETKKNYFPPSISIQKI